MIHYLFLTLQVENESSQQVIDRQDLGILFSARLAVVAILIQEIRQ